MAASLIENDPKNKTFALLRFILHEAAPIDWWPHWYGCLPRTA